MGKTGKPEFHTVNPPTVLSSQLQSNSLLWRYYCPQLSNLSSNISLAEHNAKVSERYDILSSIQQIYTINFQSLEF